MRKRKQADLKWRPSHVQILLPSNNTTWTSHKKNMWRSNTFCWVAVLKLLDYAKLECLLCGSPPTYCLLVVSLKWKPTVGKRNFTKKPRINQEQWVIEAQLCVCASKSSVPVSHEDAGIRQGMLLFIHSAARLAEVAVSHCCWAQVDLLVNLISNHCTHSHTLPNDNKQIHNGHMHMYYINSVVHTQKR